MTNDEKLMQQALEALLTCTWSKQTDAAIAALRERLAQPAKQPVQEPEYTGWYCAHCQRGVDGSEVTYHEQHTVCGRVITDDVSPKAQQQEPVAWRELCRRLYVELFHCDQQMMATLDDDGEPVWTQGKTVRDVLADAKAALDTSPPASKQLTDEMVVAAARMLSDRQAAACNVDCGDMWKVHGYVFLEDARAALEAAHGIKVDA